MDSPQHILNSSVQDYAEDGDDPLEEEIVSLDKPDFVSGGGLIAVTEGGKVVMPCQVNGLGGRQVQGGGVHHDYHVHCFRHYGPKSLEL